MKAAVAKVTNHDIPEIFLPKLPRLLMLMKVVYECASESDLSEEKRITSPMDTEFRWGEVSAQGLP